MISFEITQEEYDGEDLWTLDATDHNEIFWETFGPMSLAKVLDKIRKLAEEAAS